MTTEALLAIAALCIDCGTQVGKDSTRCRKCQGLRATDAATAARGKPKPVVVVAPVAEKPLCIDGTLAHHWAIQTPSGPTCLATCKRCGVERAYPAAVDSWDADGLRPIAAMHITPRKQKSVSLVPIDPALTTFVTKPFGRRRA